MLIHIAQFREMGTPLMRSCLKVLSARPLARSFTHLLARSFTRSLTQSLAHEKCGIFDSRVHRVATHLENLEKSGNLKVVRENGKSQGRLKSASACS